MVAAVAGTFARPGMVRQGWYLVARSSRIRTGQVRAIEVGARRRIVYRGYDGRAHVTDDRCPHLGSDLALARVTPEGLRGEFHGWCWRADGSCVDAPGNPAPPERRLRRYAAEERWGSSGRGRAAVRHFRCPTRRPEPGIHCRRSVDAAVPARADPWHSFWQSR